MPRYSTDDDDDRPRRRRPDPEPVGGSKAVLWVALGVGGVVALAVAGGAAWWFVGKKPPAANNAPAATNTPTTGGNLQAKNTPAGAAKKDGPPALTPRHTIKTGIREVGGLYLSADGGRLVARGDDGPGGNDRTEVWDLRPEPKKVKEYPKQARGLSPDGKLTAIGTLDGTQIVEIDTGKVVSSPPVYAQWNVFAGPWVFRNKLDPRPAPAKGSQLVVTRFDPRTGQPAGEVVLPLDRFTDRVVPVKDGTELVVGYETPPRVEVWSFETGKWVSEARLAGTNEKDGWNQFAATADGKRVVNHWKTSVSPKVYDTATGAEVDAGPEPADAVGLRNALSIRFVPGRPGLLLGHDHWSTGSFTDGSHRSHSGYRAYDTARRTVVADLPGAYLFPALSADGKVMVSMTDRAAPTLLVWDLTAIP